MKMKKPVFCLGLTPALQRTVLVSNLTLGEVNRTRQVMESAGGKMVNTARALATLGNEVMVAGFNGGDTGRRILECLKVYGVENQFTEMRKMTRTCTTLLDQQSGSVTEIVEEAPPIELPDVKKMSLHCSSLIPKSSVLVIAGTLPSYVSDHFYIKFAEDAQRAKVPLVIDSHGTAILHTLSTRPLLAKMSVMELGITFGCKMTSDEKIAAGMKELFDRGARNVLITADTNGGYFYNEDGLRHFESAKVRNVVNPIGSGDCATAGFVDAYLRKLSLDECVRFSMACGGANVESLLPADFAMRRVNVLYKELLKRREPK
jgi:tagatose 6-phosphate kinase